MKIWERALQIVILVLAVAAAYMFGKADGYRAGADYALAEMERQLPTAMDEQLMQAAQMGIDETMKQLDPVLKQWEQLSKDLLADLQEERQWSDGLSRLSAEWLYSAQDPQEAHDLLWCASGHATPFDVCLQQLKDGRSG